MVAGGIGDVLVSNEVAGARQARPACRAGAPGQDRRVRRRRRQRRRDRGGGGARPARRLDVLVEIDVGGRRCGVAPGEPAARLARLIAELAAICALPACRPTTARPSTCARRPSARRRSRGAVEHVKETLAGAGGRRPRGRHRHRRRHRHLRERGGKRRSTPSCRPAPTSSWTPTTPATSAPTAAPFDTFEHALFVYATAMSAPAPERVVVDAGHKALAVDSGMPPPWQLPGAIYHRPSDEHGILDVAACNRAPGARATRCCWCPATAIRPSTCTTGTSACADLATGEARVECLWPVAARGALF